MRTVEADGGGDPRRYLPGGDPHGIARAGILAYFPRREPAEAAAGELRDAGLGPVEVSALQPQPVDRAELEQRPCPRVELENATPDLPVDPRTGRTVLVALSAKGADAERALKILRAHGAAV
jgi:hypothetical protein